MGCSVGKLDSRKMKHSPVLDVNDIKIQTVLQLNASSDKKHSGKSKRTPRHRRKGEAPSKSGRHRGPSVKHDKAPAPVGSANKNYDPKITAKYDIKAVIGKGTYSRVLRVEHRTSKQPFALKAIEASSGRSAFEVELAVLRRLNHPNVIKLIEVFDWADSPKLYMVLELCTGGSLLDRLEGGGCRGEEGRAALKMLLEGMRHLHALGITHRDLKPDNLLYYHPGKDSRLLITDFSFASCRKPSGQPFMHTVCGTPQYVAPEVVSRQPYTCAVDVWAAGVVAHMVLGGAFPFDAPRSDAAVFKLILKGEVRMDDEVWCNVSEEAKSFVRHLLCADPALRPTAGAALRHAFFTASSLTYTPPHPNSAPASGRSSNGGSSRTSSGGGLRAAGRVRPAHLDALLQDPEVAALLGRRPS